MEATPPQEIYFWLFIRLCLICAVINIHQLQFLTLQRCLLRRGAEGMGADGTVGLPSPPLQPTALKENQSN